MTKRKVKARAEITADTLETALNSLSISSSVADTDGVPIITPTTSVSGQVVRGSAYFEGFPDFTVNHSAPLRNEFDRLAKAKGWGKKTDEYRIQRINCLTMEFDLHYGHLTSTNLEAWQNLCLDLLPGSTPPASITQCKKVLSKIYVNIHDYIDCKRADRPIQPVFKNWSKFAKHTRPDKIYPLKAAKNVPAYKALLERVFARFQK